MAGLVLLWFKLLVKVSRDEWRGRSQMKFKIARQAPASPRFGARLDGTSKNLGWVLFFFLLD